MTKILLVYPPFCTPASPPYSIAYLCSFLKNNCDLEIEVLDLNIMFHSLKYPSYQHFFQDSSGWDWYETKASEYNKLTTQDYADNNKKIRQGGKPALFSQMLEKIKEKDADIVAFSIVYSSQAFYANILLSELKDRVLELERHDAKTHKQAHEPEDDFSMEKESHGYDFDAVSLENNPKKIVTGSKVMDGSTPKKADSNSKIIRTIVGGPAVNEVLTSKADYFLKNEIELLENITGKEVDHASLKLDFAIDFSCFEPKNYFVPQMVVPLKTSTTCYHKGCTFCSHYAKVPYAEYSLDAISRTVKDSKAKCFFLIDDMIPALRLLKLAAIFGPLGVRWGCQLRPTKEFTFDVLKKLHDCGLDFVIWGVESGSDRVLKAMKKGTNSSDVSLVLENSSKAGIKNICYIMFGFPTETKEEFLETISFLQGNASSIDLVSTSVFGLLSGTPMHMDPSLYGISEIVEEKRMLLGPKLSYTVSSGLTQQEAKDLRDNYKRTLEKMNRFPKSMNFFREHVFFKGR